MEIDSLRCGPLTTSHSPPSVAITGASASTAARPTASSPYTSKPPRQFSPSLPLTHRVLITRLVTTCPISRLQVPLLELYSGPSEFHTHTDPDPFPFADEPIADIFDCCKAGRCFVPHSPEASSHRSQLLHFPSRPTNVRRQSH